MKKVAFIIFLLGAGGMDSPNMIVPAVMVFSGLGILAISAWRERRRLWQEQHTTQKNFQKFSDVQKVRHTHLSA